MKNIKNTKILCMALMAAALCLTVYSCGKTAVSTAPTVTEADAAELTTDAVIPSTGGIVTQMNSSIDIHKNVVLPCGIQKDSSIVKASATGAAPAYTYNLNWSYSSVCDGLIPNLVTFSFTGNGSYDGPRMSSTDNTAGGFTLSQLGAGAANYAATFTYTRTGSTTSKILRQNTFNSTLSLKSTNLVVDKTTEEIISGTATVSIIATSSAGKSFSFNGIITFLGNKQAKVVLNSGITYNIQWS